MIYRSRSDPDFLGIPDSGGLSVEETMLSGEIERLFSPRLIATHGDIGSGKSYALEVIQAIYAELALVGGVEIAAVGGATDLLKLEIYEGINGKVSDSDIPRLLSSGELQRSVPSSLVYRMGIMRAVCAYLSEGIGLFDSTMKSYVEAHIFSECIQHMISPLQKHHVDKLNYYPEVITLKWDYAIPVDLVREYLMCGNGEHQSDIEMINRVLRETNFVGNYDHVVSDLWFLKVTSPYNKDLATGRLRKVKEGGGSEVLVTAPPEIAGWVKDRAIVDLATVFPMANFVSVANPYKPRNQNHNEPPQESKALDNQHLRRSKLSYIKELGNKFMGVGLSDMQVERIYNRLSVS